MGYLDATGILLKKNVLLSFRDSAALTITILAAFFSMLVLYFSQLSLDSENNFSPESLNNEKPTPRAVSSIPRCVPFSHDDCYTFAYLPKSNPDVVSYITTVAQRNNIPLNETIAFQTEDQLNDFLVSYPNRTQAAYIFDQDSLTSISTGDVRYIVQYNESEQFDFPLGRSFFHADVVVPAMIHNMNLVLMPKLSNKKLNVNLNLSVFPHPSLIELDNSGDGLDAFGQYGPVLTFATYFLSLVFFLYKIVLEKERGLRGAMRLAGQSQSQHYISWFIPILIINLTLTLLMIAFGRAFGFAIFKELDFSIYFLTMFIFSLSILCWTFFLASVVSKSTAVSVVSFNFFIFGYVLASSGGIVYIVYRDGEPAVGKSFFFLRQVFAILPGTTYVKALNDLSASALQKLPITLSTAGSHTSVFPVRECWFWMLGSGLVALVISIYLDNIIAIKHGVALSPFYMFQKSYWLPGSIHDINIPNTKHDDTDESTSGDSHLQAEGIEYFDPNVEDADVRIEREAVANGLRDNAALVIKGLTRRFGQNVAVDDVSFSVRQGTAFALLGHNGAGKSTLFNMLVTALKPNGGDAFIYGKSVRSNKEQVRKVLGVCPQFDLFWDKLTGAEHIEIFSALKGLSKAERRMEINERLEDVELTKKGNVYAGEYSGGMQRRLSVALSLTGDPKVILLDECTSGADPLVRRDLWAAIERAKAGRVVFLITHSIAEAQHIAGNDQIGIMAQGKLRVLGNALHLKTKFGAGYGILAVMHSAEEAHRLLGAITTKCAGAELTSSTLQDNGELLASFSLPRNALESDVLQVVEMLENQKAEFGIRELSINSTSLGEVFKSITSLSEDVHHDGDLENEE